MDDRSVTRWGRVSAVVWTRDLDSSTVVSRSDPDPGPDPRTVAGLLLTTSDSESRLVPAPVDQGARPPSYPPPRERVVDPLPPPSLKPNSDGLPPVQGVLRVLFHGAPTKVKVV